MKRYCREGKKCTIEAAKECGAVYKAMWNAGSSAVQLSAMWPPVQCSAGKEELHESICVEGGEGGGGQARAIGGCIKKNCVAGGRDKKSYRAYGRESRFIDGFQIHVCHIYWAKHRKIQNAAPPPIYGL